MLRGIVIIFLTLIAYALDYSIILEVKNCFLVFHISSKIVNKTVEWRAVCVAKNCKLVEICNENSLLKPIIDNTLSSFRITALIRKSKKFTESDFQSQGGGEL